MVPAEPALDRIEIGVVGSAARSALRETLACDVVRQREIDHGVDGRGVGLGLGDGAREPVEDVSLAASGAHRVTHDGQDEIVGHELAAVEHRAELARASGVVGRPRAQEIPHRDDGHTEVPGECRGLRALSRARLPEQRETNRPALSIFRVPSVS